MQDLESVLPAKVKGSLSIDRVTFLVYCPRLSAWAKESKEIKSNERRINKMAGFVQHELASVLDDDFPQGTRSELFLHHFRTVDGIDIQLGASMPKRNKVTDETLLANFGSMEDQENGYMFRYSPNDYAFRVEYNPNKTSLDSINSILDCFRSFSEDAVKMIRIARIDIAIDYEVAIDAAAVFSRSFKCGDVKYKQRGIETHYFGSRNSKYMFRLYDKRAEKKDKEGIDIGHDLWRLELESKESFFLLKDLPDFGNVFDRVSFLDSAVSSDDPFIDLIRFKASFVGLNAVLNSFSGKVSRMTLYKYRKFFESTVSPKVEPPSDVVRRELELKYNALRASILKAFGCNITT